MIVHLIAAIGAVAIAAMSTTALAGSTCAAPAAMPAAGATTEKVRNFVLTEERVEAFGRHKTVTEPGLRYGEPLHVYGEPEGFGWHERNGKAKFNVVVDVELRRRDGRLVSGSPDPRTLAYEAATRPSEFFFSFSLNIRLPAGPYRLIVKLRDTVTGEMVEKSFPFSMVDRPAATARVEAKATTAKASAPKSGECKKYFPQIGKMLPVPCER